MKNREAPPGDLRLYGRGPLITKIGLGAVFLLGTVLLLLGWRGQTAFESSGFSSESGYQAVYSLSGDTAKAWRNVLLPDLEALGAEERAGASRAAKTLLAEDWDGRKSGGAAEAEALADGDEALTWRLLYASYLVNGPKIGASVRKGILAAAAGSGQSWRTAVLRALTDESAPLPAGADTATEGLSGTQRGAMLAQAYFIAGGSTGDTVSDHVAAFKKSVRDKERQVDAFRMIARGEISWTARLIVTYSRTVMLLGILLMLDTVLLTLLMLADRTWIVDFKWILILLIVDFLLYF